ncbi:hypothetical protein FVE85_2972 [Porphyridium purpureum]|uniref:Uncharacterized protein n=1 Tax=Porphyridium purpureum TaxID=35688 RepID=A0A5J4YTA7_PORPP|nr:hypothetical protein FVE85_2972 [Porphyridium purpureum]|eukprot:POR2308..scf227_4
MSDSGAVHNESDAHFCALRAESPPHSCQNLLQAIVGARGRSGEQRTNIVYQDPGSSWNGTSGSGSDCINGNEDGADGRESIGGHNASHQDDVLRPENMDIEAQERFLEIFVKFRLPIVTKEYEHAHGHNVTSMVAETSQVTITDQLRMDWRILDVFVPALTKDEVLDLRDARRKIWRFYVGGHLALPLEFTSLLVRDHLTVLLKMSVPYLRPLRLESEIGFLPEDLLQTRNVPKVLKTLVVLARIVDPASFAHACHQMQAERYANFEFSTRDGTSRSRIETAVPPDTSIAYAFLQASQRQHVRIVVHGAHGSGKSALINALMEHDAFVGEHHPLAFVRLSSDTIAPTEVNKIAWHSFVLARQEKDKTGDCDYLPVGTDVLSTVARCENKAAALTIHEVPSCEQFAGGRLMQDDVPIPSRIILNSGDFRSVRQQLGGQPPADAVFLVERADDLRLPSFYHSYRALRAFYGNRVWERLIVILTHASSRAPASMKSQHEFEQRRIELVRACLLAHATVPGLVQVALWSIHLLRRIRAIPLALFRRCFRPGRNVSESETMRSHPVQEAQIAAPTRFAESVPIVFLENATRTVTRIDGPPMGPGIPHESVDSGMRPLFDVLYETAILGQRSVHDAKAQANHAVRTQPLPLHEQALPVWQRVAFGLVVFMLVNWC